MSDVKKGQGAQEAAQCHAWCPKWSGGRHCGRCCLGNEQAPSHEEMLCMQKEEVWPLSSSYGEPWKALKQRHDVVKFTFQAFPLGYWEADGLRGDRRLRGEL